MKESITTSRNHFYDDDVSFIDKTTIREDFSRADYYFVGKNNIWFISCLHELDTLPRKGVLRITPGMTWELMSDEEVDGLLVLTNSYTGLEGRQDLQILWATIEYKKNREQIDVEKQELASVVMLKFTFTEMTFQFPWIDWGAARRSYNHTVLSDHKVHYFFDIMHHQRMASTIFWKYAAYTKRDDLDPWYKYTIPMKCWNNGFIEYKSPVKLNPVGVSLCCLKRKKDLGIARARRELKLLEAPFLPIKGKMDVLSIRASFLISLSDNWSFTSLYVLPKDHPVENVIYPHTNENLFIDSKNLYFFEKKITVAQHLLLMQIENKLRKI